MEGVTADGVETARELESAVGPGDGAELLHLVVDICTGEEPRLREEQGDFLRCICSW